MGRGQSGDFPQRHQAFHFVTDGGLQELNVEETRDTIYTRTPNSQEINPNKGQQIKHTLSHKFAQLFLSISCTLICKNLLIQL